MEKRVIPELILPRRGLRRSLQMEDNDVLDDFNIHNLKDLDTSSKLSIPRELDIQSTTSSSSTVVHNQGIDDLIGGNGSLGSKAFEGVQIDNTLEKDPVLQTKIQNKLKLASLSTQQRSLKQSEEIQEETNTTIESSLEAETTIQSMESIEDSYMDGILPSPPSSPPKELDPNKLYALFDFSGPDPSHLELSKNDSVILLNDTDSYWWLVKKDDESVGFAPAEILETYQERLARLNCWKNEILERGESGDLPNEQLKLFNTNYEDTPIPPQIPVSQTHALNESLVSIERKGSLKQRRNIVNNNNTCETFDEARKNVSFADIMEAEDDEMVPPKRLSETNFLVKHIADYVSEEDLVEPARLAQPTSLHIPKSRSKPTITAAAAANSMQMLDDLLSSFDGTEQGPMTASGDEEGLHPEVESLFAPLLDQVAELDALLQDLDFEAGPIGAEH